MDKLFRGFLKFHSGIYFVRVVLQQKNFSIEYVVYSKHYVSKSELLV
ncbi:MAG: hypothetical protein PHY57_11950 [Ignavibacterium sp.]|nr:hypothetical protein [Ignavibacterium sp.]MDD5609219.1 hypothetical protein [Ignavibacterium sp.]MDX9712504.1 hypothetical protein [Ignavibacteriaceae bacterium]